MLLVTYTYLIKVAAINYSSIKSCFRPKLSNDLQLFSWKDVKLASNPSTRTILVLCIYYLPK